MPRRVYDLVDSLIVLQVYIGREPAETFRGVEGWNEEVMYSIREIAWTVDHMNKHRKHGSDEELYDWGEYFPDVAYNSTGKQS